MRRSWIASFVVVASLVLSAALQAQTGAGEAKSVPDLSGMWEGLGGVARNADNAICGIIPVCAALLGQKPEPSPDSAEEPEMLPWAEEYFKKVHEGVALTANPPEHVNPSWNGCLPEGPVQTMQARFNRIELRQFADLVLLFYSQDHGVRRVYLDGRGHPPNVRPSTMGHSIGRYEGDTLVIETVGIKDKAWLDGKGHPHTTALRVTERIRRMQPERLEIEVTLDDPETFKKPWKMRMVKGLLAPGPEFWDTSECEELLQMGTHYSAESPLEFQKEQAAPPVGY